jgi:hypothetical protein
MEYHRLVTISNPSPPEGRNMMTAKHGVGMGPVDYLIVRFPGNRFTGRMAPEMAAWERKVRLLF